MKPRLALVDDDRNIQLSVAMALEAEGFSVKPYADGESGLAGLLKDPVDLVILDIKMPRMDGMEVLKKLREKSAVPVIFLTSKDDETDQFLGLRSGADDYITKPFSQRLLIERIRTILRREKMRAEALQEARPHLTAKGALAMDEDRYLVTWRGQEIDLTVTEFLLLKALAQNPGHVKSREQLMDFAYGENSYVDDRTVDSHIKRLRRKFREKDADFDRIDTVYGLGYRFKDV